MYDCIHPLHEFFMQTHLEKNIPSSREGFELFGEFPQILVCFCCCVFFSSFNWTLPCKKSSVYNIDCRKTRRPVSLSFPKAKLSYCPFLPGYNLPKDRLQTVKLLPIVLGLYVVLHFTFTFNRFQASVINQKRFCFMTAVWQLLKMDKKWKITLQRKHRLLFTTQAETWHEWNNTLITFWAPYAKCIASLYSTWFDNLVQFRSLIN